MRFTGKESAEQDKTISTSSKAFQMFKENRSRVDVAIDLGLDAEDVINLFDDYLRLVNVDQIMKIYRELGDTIYLLYYLFQQLKYEGNVTKDGISSFANMVGRLTRLREEEILISEQIVKLN